VRSDNHAELILHEELVNHILAIHLNVALLLWVSMRVGLHA
jgi:hypothetical protein